MEQQPVEQQVEVRHIGRDRVEVGTVQQIDQDRQIMMGGGRQMNRHGQPAAHGIIINTLMKLLLLLLVEVVLIAIHRQF